MSEMNPETEKNKFYKSIPIEHKNMKPDLSTKNTGKCLILEFSLKNIFIIKKIENVLRKLFSLMDHLIVVRAAVFLARMTHLTHSDEGAPELGLPQSEPDKTNS